MILEILVAIGFPLTLYFLGKIFAPKKPNKHKGEPFVGGEPLKQKPLYLDKQNIIFASLVITIEAAVLVLLLSSGWGLLAGLYALILLLGVWMV